MTNKNYNGFASEAQYEAVKKAVAGKLTCKWSKDEYDVYGDDRMYGCIRIEIGDATIDLYYDGSIELTADHISRAELEDITDVVNGVDDIFDALDKYEEVVNA